jgi:cytochrome c biogenesis protein
VREYATFNIGRDPGSGWALLAAALAVMGLSLSLFVRRRRAWVKVSNGPDGSTLVEIAGLSRSEAPGLTDEVDEVAAGLRAVLERN